MEQQQQQQQQQQSTYISLLKPNNHDNEYNTVTVYIWLWHIEPTTTATPPTLTPIRKLRKQNTIMILMQIHSTHI